MRLRLTGVRLAIKAEKIGCAIEDIIPYVSGMGGKEMLEDGDLEKGTLAAGQCLGLIRDIPSCRELRDRIMLEAESILRERFAGVFQA